MTREHEIVQYNTKYKTIMMMMKMFYRKLKRYRANFVSQSVDVTVDESVPVVVGVS